MSPRRPRAVPVPLRLPLELSRAIVQCIKDNTDLLTLRLVCRCFYHPATEKAFKKLKIRHNYEKSARGIWMLGKHSDVLEYAEEVIFLEKKMDPRFAGGRYLTGAGGAKANKMESGPDPLTDVLSSLHLFPRLKSVKLYFDKIWNELYGKNDDPPDFREWFYSDHLRLQIRVFVALAKNRKHSIKELKMTDVSAYPMKALVSKEFGSFLEGFKTFKFGAISEDLELVYCCLVFCQFWGCRVPGTFPTMMSFASNLVELKITSTGQCAPEYCGLDTLFFPNLDKLHLGHFLFSAMHPEEGPEGFISRHHKTMKELILEDCYMIWDNEHPADRHRFWADVWKHLESTMTAMTDIAVINSGYIYLYVGCGYMPIEEGVEGDELDEPELEKLDEKIARRV